MRDFSEFEDVFEFDPAYKYDQKTVDAIKGNRRALENELFFDKLLKVLAIDKGKHDLFLMHCYIALCL